MNALSSERKFKIINSADAGYPANLRYIYDPPAKIYVKGDLFAEDNIAVAVVGSRRATYYGIKNAEALGSELAARGITVVSGLARGVDSAAHRGALKAKGRTIAVLGNGLNVIYPRENQRLAEEIAQSGALVSEFPADTPPFRQNFPRRNRIISGLSLGVVVVEAAKRSGALITAGFALEQGRDVFAFPGKVDSFCSQGANNLIKQGAKLVETVQDIIEELEPLRRLPSAKDQGEQAKSNALNLSEGERQIYTCLTDEPLHIDEIMQKSDLSYGRFSIFLLSLQGKGLVQELPGKRYLKLN